MDKSIVKSHIDDKSSYFNAWCGAKTVPVTTAKMAQRSTWLMGRLKKPLENCDDKLHHISRTVLDQLMEDFDVMGDVHDNMVWAFIVAWSLSKQRDDEPDGERDDRVLQMLGGLFEEAKSTVRLSGLMSGGPKQTNENNEEVKKLLTLVEERETRWEGMMMEMSKRTKEAEEARKRDLDVERMRAEEWQREKERLNEELRRKDEEMRNREEMRDHERDNPNMNELQQLASLLLPSMRPTQREGYNEELLGALKQMLSEKTDKAAFTESEDEDACEKGQARRQKKLGMIPEERRFMYAAKAVTMEHEVFMSEWTRETTTMMSTRPDSGVGGYDDLRIQELLNLLKLSHKAMRATATLNAKARRATHKVYQAVVDATMELKAMLSCNDRRHAAATAFRREIAENRDKERKKDDFVFKYHMTLQHIEMTYKKNFPGEPSRSWGNRSGYYPRRSWSQPRNQNFRYNNQYQYQQQQQQFQPQHQQRNQQQQQQQQQQQPPTQSNRTQGN